jgi:hypothetical protein
MQKGEVTVYQTEATGEASSASMLLYFDAWRSTFKTAALEPNCRRLTARQSKIMRQSGRSEWMNVFAAWRRRARNWSWRLQSSARVVVSNGG